LPQISSRKKGPLILSQRSFFICAPGMAHKEKPPGEG